MDTNRHEWEPGDLNNAAKEEERGAENLNSAANEESHSERREQLAAVLGSNGAKRNGN